MGLVFTFLLGIANFAVHKAVLEKRLARDTKRAAFAPLVRHTRCSLCFGRYPSANRPIPLAFGGLSQESECKVGADLVLTLQLRRLSLLTLSS